MTDDTIAVYLNDHLGLIVGEMELISRVASENEGTSLAAFLSTYAEEVRQQRDAVESLLTSSGSVPSAVKQAAGWLAEKVGRLKPNDALTGYTDLARVVELEALIAAAQSRLLMWDSVSAFPRKITLEPTLASQQSKQHVQVLRDHHARAAQIAFPATS